MVDLCVELFLVFVRVRGGEHESCFVRVNVEVVCRRPGTEFGECGLQVLGCHVGHVVGGGECDVISVGGDLGVRVCG